MPIDLFAGIPVSTFAAGLARYERLFGTPPSFFPNDAEAVWERAEHRYVFVEQRPEHAGHARHLVFIDDLDRRAAPIAEPGLAPAEQETYPNGIRKAAYRDPDGNEFAFGGAAVSACLRRATAADADAIAVVLTAARAEQAFFPPIHTEEDNRGFVTERMLPAEEVWVAEERGLVVGFAALRDDVLGHIYLAPLAQGRGIGRLLLEKAKERRPNGFSLWTHQPNVRARAFYEREGLEAVEFTDGSTTQERVPDVRYVWRPGSSR
jgi:GNAT superfamily N-acetyltransferase